MVPIQPGSDGALERLLRSLGRAEPPEVPLEAILERWAARRRRGLALGGLVAAGLLLASALLLLSKPETDVPVHLQIRLVDVPADDGALDAGSREEPEELRGP